jgi:hypothetical protein
MHHTRHHRVNSTTTVGDNPFVDGQLYLSISAGELGRFILTEKNDFVLLSQFMLSQLTFIPYQAHVSCIIQPS